MPGPVSATSTSTPPSTSSARTVTLPSGGVWWIAFWIRLNSTRWSCSWLPCDGRSGGAARRARRRCRRRRPAASPRPRRGRARPAHPLHRPRELLGLQAREVEEVVDQRAEGAHVGVHARGVLAPLGVLDDLVVDRGGQQAQRGDRGAQVVADGGEQLAPRAPRVAARAMAAERAIVGRDADVAATGDARVRGRRARAGHRARDPEHQRGGEDTSRIVISASWLETNIRFTNSATVAASASSAERRDRDELAAAARPAGGPRSPRPRAR